MDLRGQFSNPSEPLKRLLGRACLRKDRLRTGLDQAGTRERFEPVRGQYLRGSARVVRDDA